MIKVHVNHNDQIVLTSFPKLVNSAYGANELWDDEELQDVKDFVATAAVSETVKYIEKMSSAEVLSSPIFQEILMDVTSDLTSKP